MSTDRNTLNLPLLVAARICTTSVFMVYPACLSFLLAEWDMTATEAGLVQGGFTISMALSLLVTSYLCDRFGARRVFAAASLASALAGLMAAAWARDFNSGLIMISLIGLTQGGTYTPAIMLASANAAPQRRNATVGWVLAGMSAGYVISIVLSNLMISLGDYRLAFLSVAILSVLGALLSWFSTRHAKDIDATAEAAANSMQPDQRRTSRLLILGYIGHTWELLGMWAWVPAFLAVALMGNTGMSAVELGIWTALALHMSGFFASFLSGIAADRFGARRVLIAFALLGMVCSASVGWAISLPPVLLVLLVAIYGFAAIGDSAVLSSAMADAVPPGHLGKALGLRSVLGIGAGAVAPVSFGLVLDIFPGPSGWGLGFLTLAAGGALAALCACALPIAKKIPAGRNNPVTQS
ncbi:MFS transporter [Roseibium sp. SCP14]|uniref:MFS transporter n=1 Tax=Roseibium sp. SCP14 TaxID=3141375 RepID=UPI00333C0BD3